MPLDKHRPTTILEFLDASQTTSGTLTGILRQLTGARRASIQEQLGLDKASVILELRLTSPLELPATIKAGHRAALTWAGRAGVARLEPYQYNLSSTWRAKYGDKILLSWQTDEVT